MQVRARGDESTRELEGIGVPYGVPIDIWGMREMFAPGSVEAFESKLFYGHSEPVGIIAEARSEADGWHIRGRFSKTARGDDIYTLVRDGALDSLSVYFEPLEWTTERDDDGTETVVYTRVHIREVSVVPFPAYADAKITTVRSDPNHQEEPPVTDTLTRADLDAATGDLEERFNRSLGAELAKITNTRSDAPADLPWGSAGAYLKALARGDEQAKEFHRQWTDRTEAGDAFRRAYDSATSGTSADTINRNTWIGDRLRLVEKRRTVINKFTQRPLPAEGNTLEYSKIATNTIKVGKQANEGDDLVKGKLTTTTATATVETHGGYAELTRQQIERSPINVVDTVNRAQTIEYARDSEDGARTALAALITAQRNKATGRVDVPAAPTLYEYIDALVDVVEKLDDLGFGLDGALVSKDVFKTIYRLTDGSDEFKFNVTGSGVNRVGTLDVTGLGLNFATVQFELLPGAAAGTTAFYDSVAMTTYESPGAPFELQDENIINLTKTFSVYGYLAFAAEFPEAIVPLRYAAAA
jgi:HK97 family phage prohead protease